MNEKLCSIVSMIMVVCLALEVIMKDQVEQLNKSQSRSNGNRYWWRSWEEPKVWDCVYMWFMASVHLLSCFQYIDLSLCNIWHICDLPCSVNILVRLISMVRCFKDVLAFAGQGLKYSVNMFQNKVDNWEPQAGGHVTGPWRWSESRRRDLLLSLPQAFFCFLLLGFSYFFALFFVLRPTNWMPGRGHIESCLLT